MGRRGAAAALAVLLAPSAASGACQDLDRPEPPAVTVRVSEPAEPRVVAATEAEIRGRADATGRAAPGEAVTRGLTVNEAATEVGYTLTTAARPDGARCAALKGVEAEVADREVTVLVDRKYPPGSCERRAVLDHEHEHVRINAEALRRTGALLEERLAAVADAWGGRWFSESEAGRLKAAVDDAVAEASRGAREAAEERHRRLDTPESYAEVQERCDGW